MTRSIFRTFALLALLALALSAPAAAQTSSLGGYSDSGGQVQSKIQGPGQDESEGQVQSKAQDQGPGQGENQGQVQSKLQDQDQGQGAGNGSGSNNGTGASRSAGGSALPFTRRRPRMVRRGRARALPGRLHPSTLDRAGTPSLAGPVALSGCRPAKDRPGGRRSVRAT